MHIYGGKKIIKRIPTAVFTVHIQDNYLEQAIDGIGNLRRKRCIQYVHVFSKPGDNTTNRGRIKEGQWCTHHSTQHHYVHLASSQPAAQLRCQIAEKARHRYNINMDNFRRDRTLIYKDFSRCFSDKSIIKRLN